MDPLWHPALTFLWVFNSRDSLLKIQFPACGTFASRVNSNQPFGCMLWSCSRVDHPCFALQRHILSCVASAALQLLCRQNPHFAVACWLHTCTYNIHRTSHAHTQERAENVYRRLTAAWTKREKRGNFAVHNCHARLFSRAVFGSKAPKFLVALFIGQAWNRIKIPVAEFNGFAPLLTIYYYYVDHQNILIMWFGIFFCTSAACWWKHDPAQQHKRQITPSQLSCAPTGTDQSPAI